MGKIDPRGPWKTSALTLAVCILRCNIRLVFTICKGLVE